eukprot:SAG31_NODE_283_length_18512_cov_19.352414_10_plen_91_part_00
MGVLKTLLDVNKRPDQFPAVRIFKLGKLYKKDIPTPANYEGEAPGLVLSNFLLVCNPTAPLRPTAFATHKPGMTTCDYHACAATDEGCER